MVASFSTTFPKIFAAEAFSKLGAYRDFNEDDSACGMRHTLINGFREERGALRVHI